MKALSAIARQDNHHDQEVSSVEPLLQEEGQDTVLQTLQEVESLIDTLSASWHTSPSILQSRRWHRLPYRKSILLTPIHEETDQPIADQRVATGQDISLGGICFLHDHPLPYRRITVTFPRDNGHIESLVIRLRWCRFTRHGFYQSGGKFLYPVHIEGGVVDNWENMPRA